MEINAIEKSGMARKYRKPQWFMREICCFVKTHESAKCFLPFPTKESEALKNGENMIDGTGRI